MAEEALKKLDQQLNCSICLDTFTDPKLLQCFHVYCRKCLVPLVVRDQQGKLGLTCPTCRQVTPIPDRGVAGLQSAFHINPLLEIQDVFQKVGHPGEGAVGGAMIDTPPRNVGRCFEHEEEYKLYCGTCGELICWKCGIKGGKHRDHDYEELKQTFRNYKEEITASLEPMEKQLVAIQEALAQLDACSGQISDQQTATKDSIHISFRRLHEVLNVRETELIGQLNQMTREKLKCLAAQRDQIETTLARLNSCLHFMRESLKTSSEEAALMERKNVVRQVMELIAPFNPKPNTKPDIVYLKSANAVSLCQSYGCILLAKRLCQPNPSSCHVTSAYGAVVGEKSAVVVQAISFEGRPSEEPFTSLECESVSEITGTRIKCCIERTGRSQYEISYLPTVKGRHQLYIRAEGQHIRGSPCIMGVKPMVKKRKFGAPILTVIGMSQPSEVTVNGNGEIFVAEVGRNCLSVFSPNGEKLRSFGTHGSGEGQFWHPRGVAVDSEGNILVADSGNHRIQHFSAEGQFLTAVGTKSTNGPLQFTHPNGIAFNPINNKIYIVQNHRIQVLNSDLTFFSIFGGEGGGKGQFRSPCDVACDSFRNVYVADSGNYHIQVFTAEGRFLRTFGKCGQTKGELSWSSGVAVDSASGLVYVSDSGNYCVSVFTLAGKFVASFGRRGEGLGEFQAVGGLTVDSCGVLYVCDDCNHRFLIF